MLLLFGFVFVFGQWMKCILYDWWAYKCCWMTGSNRISDSNELYFCAYVLHEFNVNELFGVSQCDDDFFFFYIQCFLMKLPKNFESFKFNVRFLPSLVSCINFNFLVRFQWIASKKLGLRQFYSYFSCRCCCERFYCSY